MNKIIIKESKPIIYVVFYMSYAFVLGLGIMGYWIYKYGGGFPATELLFKFIEDTWAYLFPLIGSPIGFKILTKVLEVKKNKKLEQTQSRRKSDNG